MIIEGVVIYILLINMTSFVIFGIDKSRAKKSKWRISEAVLFAVALLGGSVGAICGMRIFHHKTKHRKFTIGIPIMLIIQIAVMVFFYPYIPMPL